MEVKEFFAQIASGSLSGAYYLFGTEPYGRQQAVRRAIASIDETMRDLNVSVLKGAPADEIINAADSLPLFSDRRLVIVREIDADTANRLARYVEHVSETTILLIDFAGTPDKRSALYQTLKGHNRTVEFMMYEPEQATGFVEKRARENGIPIEHAAAKRIVEWVGCDLAALENTLLRVSGYVGAGQPVTLGAVETCVLPSAEYSVFVALDALIAGNRKTALTLITGMLRDGQNHPRALAAFFEGRLKQMVLARRLIDRNVSEQTILKAIGGNPYAAKMTVKNAKKCTLDQLVGALNAFGGIEFSETQGEMRSEDGLFLAVMKYF